MIDPAGLDPQRKAALAAAGQALAEAEAQMRALRTDPLRLVTGGGAAKALRHYPPGDIYDFQSHSQAYFHRHDDAAADGHFHLFRRTGPANAARHIAALVVGEGGAVVRIFTTNRWVTDEEWLPAEDMIALVPGFRLDHAGLLGRWLGAAVALYAPVIEQCLRARDAAVARWSLCHPDADPFQDQGLEVTSSCAVDDAAWRCALAAGK